MTALVTVGAGYTHKHTALPFLAHRRRAAFPGYETSRNRRHQLCRQSLEDKEFRCTSIIFL